MYSKKDCKSKSPCAHVIVFRKLYLEYLLYHNSGGFHAKELQISATHKIYHYQFSFMFHHIWFLTNSAFSDRLLVWCRSICHLFLVSNACCYATYLSHHINDMQFNSTENIKEAVRLKIKNNNQKSMINSCWWWNLVIASC